MDATKAIGRHEPVGAFHELAQTCLPVKTNPLGCTRTTGPKSISKHNETGLGLGLGVAIRGSGLVAAVT